MVSTAYAVERRARGLVEPVLIAFGGAIQDWPDCMKYPQRGLHSMWTQYLHPDGAWRRLASVPRSYVEGLCAGRGNHAQSLSECSAVYVDTADGKGEIQVFSLARNGGRSPTDEEEEDAGHEEGGEGKEGQPSGEASAYKRRPNAVRYALRFSVERNEWSVLHGLNQACFECGKTGSSVKRCGGCRRAWFCNARCHRTAWKAGHSEHCKAREEESPEMKEGELGERPERPESMDRGGRAKQGIYLPARLASRSSQWPPSPSVFPVDFAAAITGADTGMVEANTVNLDGRTYALKRGGNVLNDAECTECRVTELHRCMIH